MSGGGCEILVTDKRGNPLSGILVMVYQLMSDRDRGRHIGGGKVNGITDSSGLFVFGCRYEFEAKIFVNSRNSGTYWCENRVRISIKI